MDKRARGAFLIHVVGILRRGFAFQRTGDCEHVVRHARRPTGDSDWRLPTGDSEAD